MTTMVTSSPSCPANATGRPAAAAEPSHNNDRMAEPILGRCCWRLAAQPTASAPSNFRQSRPGRCRRSRLRRNRRQALHPTSAGRGPGASAGRRSRRMPSRAARRRTDPASARRQRPRRVPQALSRAAGIKAARIGIQFDQRISIRPPLHTEFLAAPARFQLRSSGGPAGCYICVV